MNPALRPMRLGEILDRTFQIYRERLLPFAAIGAISAAFSLAVTIALRFGWPVANSLEKGLDLAPWVAGYLASWFGSHFILAFHALLFPTYVSCAADALFGGEVSIRRGFGVVRERWRTYVWLGFLKMLLQMVIPESLLVGFLAIVGVAADRMSSDGPLFDAMMWGFVAICGVFAGYVVFWLWPRLAFSFQACLAEKLPAKAALRRSMRLSRDRRWSIVIVWAITGVANAIAWSILRYVLWWIVYVVFNAQVFEPLPQRLFWVSVYGTWGLFAALLAPVYPIAVTLLYYDQRIRKEGFDIEWMMQSAGMVESSSVPAASVESAEAEPASVQVKDERAMNRCGSTMIHLRIRSALRAVLLLGCACGTQMGRAQLVKVHPEAPAGGWRAASLAEYRAHLEALEKLTATCAKARTKEACDPRQIGPDDEIPWGSGAQQEKRTVRFGWLRVLLEEAREPDDAVKAKRAEDKSEDTGEKEDAPSTSELLEDAQTRLTEDLAQADAGATGQQSHAGERAVLSQVLAGREFRNLKQADQGPSAAERFNNWLNKMFEWLAQKHVRAAWVGRALIWGFLLVVGVGLAWALLQMERRWRVRLVPESERPASGAASARDWQLWLKDAREAAARGEWREAIHFMYWASISRLESKKLWPADRARTPREYLALVAGDDPRKTGLGALTREFEWTWYGGRPADEPDYRRAEELATGLFEGGTR